MSINVIIIIISCIIWNIREGYLVLRDSNNSKGSTAIDKLTRLFNLIATEVSLVSPLLLIFFPSFNFSGHENLFLTVIGLLLTLFGFTLRYWSISVLGKFFRTTVEIENNQLIIKNGPYKFIRHPSYSGIILFFIGFGLMTQNWLSMIICFVLPAVSLIYRMSVEEKAFVSILGQNYIEYQSKTRKLIPFIW